MDSSKLMAIPKLSGQANYEIWALRMKAVLIEKNLWDYMLPSNSLSPGDMTPESAKLLQSGANRALALMQLSLQDRPLLQIRHIVAPLDAWTALRELYSPRGFSSEFLLFKELFTTSLSSENGSMEAFLHKVKRLVDDLLAKGNELPTKLVISWVLNNLTSDYESFVANTIQTIRLNEASVSLENLFSSLLDESRRLQGLESPSQALVASKRLARKANATVSQPNAAGKQCNFCKRPGHVEATCWKKYPSKNARHRTKAKPKKANTSIIDASDDEEQQLLSAVVLHTVQIQDWILDSGATTHICCNRDAFTSISSSSTLIQWGAGASIKASGIGSVAIQLPNGSKATLQKVLLVPELKVNLVALSQLIQKGLRVKFSASNAEISLQNG